MSAPLPECIDPWRAALECRSWSGTLSFDEFPRLTRVLAPPDPETATGDGAVDSDDSAASDLVRCELHIVRDTDGAPLVSGVVSAWLPLICQRCLGRMRFACRSVFDLVVVRSPDAEPSSREPLWLEDGVLRPRELIEDELLLSIPLVPLHDPQQCGNAGWRETAGALSRSADGGEARRPSAFAALAQWRGSAGTHVDPSAGEDE